MQCFVDRCVSFVLSFTASDYPFGIFKRSPTLGQESCHVIFQSFFNKSVTYLQMTK